MSTQVHDHDAWLESAALYVIDAMTDEERRSFETHLRDCEHCRAEVASLQGVDEALASAVPQVDPPAALRDRVMASVLGSEPAKRVEPRPRCGHGAVAASGCVACPQRRTRRLRVFAPAAHCRA